VTVATTTLLTGATLVELEPASLEPADLRLDGGRIVERGPSLAPREGEEVVALAGRLVLPGFVSAHHRLASVALRGHAPTTAPLKRARLEAFEAALGPDELRALAAAAALEGLCAGTTTVVHLQAAGPRVEGALASVASGLDGVGLRGVLACEVSDAAGPAVREAALAECRAFGDAARGRFRGAFAVGHLESLSDEALADVASARDRAEALLLGALGRRPAEERESEQRFGLGPVERLRRAGLVGPFTALASNIHLSWPQLNQLLEHGPYLVHTARSNMATQAGVAAAGKFGVRACLGTDLMSLDLVAEAQAASLRSLDAGQPLDVLHLLASGQRLATEGFGRPVGPLREGAAADLVVLELAPPTVLDAGTLAAHLLSLSARAVESVMVDGLWRLWKRRPLGVDEGAVAAAAQEAARAGWARLERH
jgi:cytosine/adenosine deaminase-related metal-dependent hydrolase